MAGGSAGAICWFDGGHSDSMDPDTYRTFVMEANQQEGNQSTSTFHFNPDNTPKPWSYIRVSGLSILPGLFSSEQCSIILRYQFRYDIDYYYLAPFVTSGQSHDNYAALVLDGEEFRVLSMPGAHGGSVPVGDLLKPGVWIKYVEKGVLRSKICPSYGKVAKLLQMIINPEKDIWNDERVELCRAENPVVL
eukprot:scaffold113169_cov23-Cyclotella_meneghiniana.AAC.2